MKIVEVLIEHASHSLNRPFSYIYNGSKNIVSGVRVLLDFNFQELIGYVLNVKESNKTKEELEEELGFSLSEIKDVIDDPDGYDGLVFNRWLADMARKGEPIDWDEFWTDKV